jgi:hypothetical protein
MPANSFARGGGSGGHFGGGGGHVGGFHGGFGAEGSRGVAHGFHGSIANGGRGYEASRRGGGGLHHWYRGNYGYFSPFDYGLDDYAGPYYDDSGSLDVQTESPEASMSLIASVQKELAQLGYYHGPIDGIAGLETERASAGSSQ